MIVAISGKIGSGKDTVARLLQYFSLEDIVHPSHSVEDIVADEMAVSLEHHSEWDIKKFADKMKDTVCLWLGCTREELENREFKEKELGEEWHVWYAEHQSNRKIFRSEQEQSGYLSWLSEVNYDKYEDTSIGDYRLTPRKLLQLLGTQAGRQIIHPDIWVNTLFADYTDHLETIPGYSINAGEVDRVEDYWIISDMRFPNELKGVEERHGIVVRVERDTELRFPELWKSFQESDADDWERWLKAWHGHMYDKLYHESETALDNYHDWDFVINNNGTLDELFGATRALHEAL